MTDEIKKIFSATDVGVLIEDFDKKLDVVAEGVLTLDKKVDALALRMDGVEDRLDKIDAEIMEIKIMLSGKADTARLEDLEKRITKLEAEQKELRSKVGAVS